MGRSSLIAALQEDVLPTPCRVFFLSFLIPDSSRPSHQTVRTGYFILDISRTDHWPRQRKSWYIPTKETTSRGSGSPGPGPFLPFSTPRSLVARLVGVGSFSRKVANYRPYLVLGCRYVYVKIFPIRHKLPLQTFMKGFQAFVVSMCIIHKFCDHKNLFALHS